MKSGFAGNIECDQNPPTKIEFRHSSPNNAAVTIESGAKLTGTGKIGGAVAINAADTLDTTATGQRQKMTFDSNVAFGAGSYLASGT